MHNILLFIIYYYFWGGNSARMIWTYFFYIVYYCSLTSWFLHPSLRMIQEPTKRTPCFLPAVLFPQQRPARTTWSTTHTSAQSRNPKWGGRNDLNWQTCIYHSAWCFHQPSQQILPQRGAAQQLLSLSAGTSTAADFGILTDFYWR